MADYVNAWQCLGCGKVEAPQPCIGICQDRRVQFVYAYDYEQALGEVARLRSEAAALGSLIRQLAWTTPRDGQWEGSYLALQKRAREVLSAQGSTGMKVA